MNNKATKRLSVYLIHNYPIINEMVEHQSKSSVFSALSTSDESVDAYVKKSYPFLLKYILSERVEKKKLKVPTRFAS